MIRVFEIKKFKKFRGFYLDLKFKILKQLSGYVSFPTSTYLSFFLTIFGSSPSCLTKIRFSSFSHFSFPYFILLHISMDLSEVEHNSKSGRGVGSYICVMRSVMCRSSSISPITSVPQLQFLLLTKKTNTSLQKGF